MAAPPCLAISNAPPRYESVEALRAASNFGDYGGRYIPETLVAAHEELERIYVACTQDPEFAAELDRLGRDYIGRPTPLYFAKRLTALAGGAQIWLKREELAFTGSHKINNALGQALVAKRIGKPRVIAETGAGQHGVATATACALLDLQCVVYMGADDVERQALNVFRMKMCVVAGSAASRARQFIVALCPAYRPPPSPLSAHTQTPFPHPTPPPSGWAPRWSPSLPARARLRTP